MTQLAIIAPNRDKYSETFIHRHVQQLPGPPFFLHGAYLPTHFAHGWHGPDQPLYQPSLLQRITAKLLKRPIRPTPQQQEAALATFLRASHITTVLAEYGPTGVAVMHPCTQAQVPLFVHFHGYDACRTDILQDQGRHYPALFQAAQGLIVVSNHMRQQLISLGAPSHKIHLIPYGVESFSPAQQPRQPGLILHVGRWVEKKAPIQALDTFAQALQTHSHLRLLMIGDGPLAPQVHARIAELDIAHAVSLPGPLPYPQVRAWMQQAELLILPSRHTPDGDTEGLPLVILEAMAAHLPILATHHGGIPDAITTSVTGILVEADDPQGFVQNLRYLVQDPLLRHRLAARAYEKYLSTYTADISLSALGALLQP